MRDLSWMLNPKAIRQSKECIRIVKDISGTRLKLSDPGFILTLREHAELSGSRLLSEAYTKLIAMAGVGNPEEPREVVACEDPSVASSLNKGKNEAAGWSSRAENDYRASFQGQANYS